jgi:predicted Rossmann-fold nucleotide-binding protein
MLEFDYFFIAQGNVHEVLAGVHHILPGGFGTMDESFEAITLIQTGKIARFPIVFCRQGLLGRPVQMGRGYACLKPKNTTSVADDLNLYRVVDTAEEAAEHIFRFYDKYVLKPNF